MSDYARRNSDEMVECECGCGTLIKKYDKKGRERKRLKGHQRTGKPFSVCNMKNFTEEQLKETKLCECGCGTEILKYDKGKGTERKFVNGHQTKGKNHPMLGRQHSDETKTEFSRVRTGKKKPEHVAELIRQRNLENWKDPEYREKMENLLYENSMKIKDDPEILEKIRQAQLNLWSDPEYYLSRLGENSPSWKGGCSIDEYCEIWKDKQYREDIKDRDDFKCQNPFCNHKTQELVVHHINYNKKDCSPKNLITVCRSCNRRAEFNKEKWQDLYTTIMKDRGLA